MNIFVAYARASEIDERIMATCTQKKAKNSLIYSRHCIFSELESKLLQGCES